LLLYYLNALCFVLFFRKETDEPVAVLRCFVGKFLQGRELDVAETTEVPTGETSAVFVGRFNLYEDAVSEIAALENLRLPLDITFYGEEGEDFGGPRKEFFRLIIENIRERLFDTDGQLITDATKVARREYYASGILLGQ